MPVIRQFFKNWGHFSLEVNALNAVSCPSTTDCTLVGVRYAGERLKKKVGKTGAK